MIRPILLALALGSTDSSAARLLQHHVSDYLERQWRRHPEAATAAGIHRYDRRSSDLRAGAQAEEERDLADRLARLSREVDTTRLDEDGRVDFLLLRAALETALASLQADDPVHRVPSHYLRFGGVYELIESDMLDPATRLSAAAARLATWPAAFELARRQLERPPRLWTELAQSSARGIAQYLRTRGMAAADSAPRRLAERFERSAERAAAALDDYARWLTDTLLERSDGIWAAGAARYDFLLARSKLLPFTAAELIALGERWMQETEDSLAALARRLDPRRSWRELVDSAKTLHPERDSVRAAYAREAYRARDFIALHRLFAIPPGERLDMVDTPPNLRATYAYGGYDSPPPFAPTKVGRFFVTPVESSMTPAQVASKLRGHNDGWITVVAVHEGYPGHHLQYVFAQTNPRLARRVFGSEVFTEGWGLYAEELMYQAGFYRSPLARLIQLQMRLWRAARVVIDPSIHTGRMTFEGAVDYFVTRVGLERADAVAEVTRYTTWPTQAVSYLVGMREIERLRADLRAELGARFDEREFHQALLRAGSLPPVLMRRAARAGLMLGPEHGP